MYGLPTIIPFSYRKIMRIFIDYGRGSSGRNQEIKKVSCDLDITSTPLDNNEETILGFPYKYQLRCIRAVLTLLSIYRVFPTKPKVSLDTITSPQGEYDVSVLPEQALRESVKELVPSLELKVGKSYLIGGESAGPNSKKSIWGTEADAVAFVSSFKHLISLIKLNGVKNVKYSIYFLIILVLSLPFYGVDYLFSRKKAKLGKLSVVYDQAGKARVIAITNWWIQQCLKPLHDSIFSLLKTFPTDGTFNQLKPLQTLVRKNKRMYGFDLSAATDRLPIDLQVQILNILKYNGNEWKNLLSIPWDYKGKDIYYSVGQPMGAYSSWGMLALTHHVLVRYSARRAGVTDFNDYAILGDDVVIANDIVAHEYLLVMKSLGLSINLSKSVISSRFTEFAKVWLGPRELNLSPLGPGLILQAMRHKFYVPRMIIEGRNLGLIPYYSPGTLSNCIPKFLRKKDTIGIILGSYLLNKFTKEPIILSKNKFSTLHFRLSSTLINKLYALFFKTARRNIDLGRTKMVESLLHLLAKGWRTSTTRLGPLFIADLVWFLIKPGFWYYLKSLDKSLSEYLTRSMEIDDFENSLKEFPGEFRYERIMASYLTSIVVSSIDWKDKENLRTSYETLKEVLKVLPPVNEWHGFDINKHLWYSDSLAVQEMDLELYWNNKFMVELQLQRI
uniref:RNA-dependent RNA polymerase n=1 Tax=Exserohilum turcicum mitovirus 5 TaxID=3229029 RepID=A0AAU7YEH1_9VIRU